MTTDTKLADFAAEFLDLKMANPPPITPENLFYDDVRSPYLAHLAKREMEKRGFKKFNHFYDGTTHKFEYWKTIGSWNEYKEDENEYIALWSAIEASGEK